MRALDRFLQTILFVIAFAIITGGGIYEIAGIKIEVSSVDAWAFGITAILFGLSFKKDLSKLKTWQLLNRFIEKLKSLSTTRNLLIIGGILFSTVFLAHLARHFSYNTEAFDSAYVNQALFYPFGEAFLECDLCKGQSRLSNHLGLSLVTLAPLTGFIHSNIFVFFLEAFLIGGALIALIKYGPLAKRKELWIYALVLLFSHRAFKNALIWDFKSDHLGEMFLFLTFLFLYKKRLVPFVLCYVASLVSKEHTPFIFPLLSLPIWMEKELPYSKRERKNLILFICLSSLLWLGLAFGVLFPYFLPKDPSHAPPALFTRLGVPGETKKEVILNLLFNPQVWWQLFSEKLLNMTTPRYTIMLYLPFFYLLWKRWWWILATVSVLGMNLLSRYWTMTTMEYHYECFILPTLYFGALLTLRESRKNQVLIWSLLLMLSTSGRWPGRKIQENLPTIAQIRDEAFYHSLPDRGVYFASDFVIPHIAMMKEIRQLSYPSGHPKSDKTRAMQKLLKKNPNLLGADHILIDTTKAWDRLALEYLQKKGFERQEKTPSGRVIYLKNAKNLTSDS